VGLEKINKYDKILLHPLAHLVVELPVPVLSAVHCSVQ